MKTPWTASFEELGGCECLSDAYRITDADGGYIAALDVADYAYRMFGRFDPYSETGPLAEELEKAKAEAHKTARLIAAAPALAEAVLENWLDVDICRFCGVFSDRVADLVHLESCPVLLLPP